MKAGDKDLIDLPKGAFDRLAKTVGDVGYYYGLLKDDRPEMPESQLRCVSVHLGTGWLWVNVNHTGNVIIKRRWGRGFEFIAVKKCGGVIGDINRVN